jgi:drug/metabolite transporter (DMT)-like permease
LDALTITLMLAAAVLHASWHSLVKSGSHGLAVLTGMCLVSALAAACVLPFVSPPPSSVWPILLLSIVLHSGYRLCLAQAYKHGDLSQAYPMARGMVPLIAAAFAIPLLRQVPTPGELLGIVIISAGLLALAGESFSRKMPGQLLAAAALAAAAVASYSTVDAYGIRTSGDWISYTAWLIALDSGIFFVVVCLVGGRPMLQALADQQVRTLISALLGLVSFCVFLWALSRSPVGAVSALRETSILFATLIGMGFHGDRRSALRIVAALLITAGIVVIAVVP